MADSTMSGLPADIAAGAAQAPSAIGEYEFSAGENAIFAELRSAMSVVGIGFFVLGAISVLGGLAAAARQPASGISGLLSGTLYILIGSWTRSAAAAFGRIATTHGNDVTNLMTAMGELLRM